MEEQILKDILVEMKGIRQDLSGTNQRLDRLEQTTNSRFERLENKIEGLHSSLVVMQQGFSDIRRDISGIKEILAEKVIWQNDNITIESKEGIVAEGIIRHLSRK